MTPRTSSPQLRSNGLLFAVISSAVVIVAMLIAIVAILSERGADQSKPAAVPNTVAVDPTPSLNRAHVEFGIVRILEDSYGIGDVSDVKCPDQMPIRASGTYTCTVLIGGECKDVGVKVTTDNGNFEVGRPQ